MSLQEYIPVKPIEGRVSKVLSLMSQGIELKEVAKLLNFNDLREMGDYMREKGYKWNATESNYIKTSESHSHMNDNKEDTTQNSVIRYESNDPNRNLFQFFEENKDKLRQILNDGIAEVPRYMLPGINRTKSFHLNYSLEVLTKEFSEEKNVPQKDIIQVALVDFFKRYGYQNEITRLIGR